LEVIEDALSTPKTREELIEITKLPERTLRYNLSILKKQGIIKEIRDLNDLRRKIFSFNGISFVKLEELREHEDVDLKHLKRLKEEIVSNNILKMPIVIDKNTKVILDGEHRFNILKELDYKKIPVIFVDYNSPEIQVKTWRDNRKLTKEKIIEAGLTGKKFPPKTSKHMIKIGNKLKHISFIEKKINIPLEKLKGD
jgi:DNA-binding transcriptional ArsR family regulator